MEDPRSLRGRSARPGVAEHSSEQISRLNFTQMTTINQSIFVNLMESLDHNCHRHNCDLQRKPKRLKASFWSCRLELNHSFIHSGYFYSNSSSLLLLLRGAPDTERILC